MHCKKKSKIVGDSFRSTAYLNWSILGGCFKAFDQLTLLKLKLPSNTENTHHHEYVWIVEGEEVRIMNILQHWSLLVGGKRWQFDRWPEVVNTENTQGKILVYACISNQQLLGAPPQSNR